jgi:hypothetical protein
MPFCGVNMSMTCNYIPEANREKLEKFFDEGANRVPSEPEHWIHGADEGLSYCFECCEKEVERLSKENPKKEYCVDGGWDIEGNSTPFCEGCGKLLENTLTDYGCESEVEHFLSYKFDLKSNDDRRAMSEVIAARGWEPFVEQCYRDEYDKKSDLDYFDDLHKLCKIILGMIRKAEKSH